MWSKPVGSWLRLTRGHGENWNSPRHRDRTSELPQPSKSEVERSKPPLWSQVTIKPNHYLSGEEGTITQFPTPQTAMVALSNGDRELIKLQDLEWTTSIYLDEVIKPSKR